MAPFSSLLSVLALVLPAALAQDACNGHAEYCDRIWSNVSQVGSHDSAFVGELPTENQYLSVGDQLGMGVRFLQGQTHNFAGELQLCHTSCFEEDAGSVADYLGTLKSFLDANPNEVLTLLLTNGDNVDVSMFDTVFSQAGMTDYAYVPPNSPSVLGIGDWPTLSDMISSGKRLVFFLDYGADMSRFPYILDEFSYFFETPFDVTDSTFADCSVNRPAGASASGRMYIVNHFLDVSIFGILVPDSAAIDTTNAASGTGSIGANVAECYGLYTQNPKAVLLDFIDQGQSLQAEAAMNGISS